MKCPFCKCDPFHYVDNGIGLEAVAVTCCDLGVELSYGAKVAKQALRFMRSHSPRKKAKAMEILRDYGLRPEKKPAESNPAEGK